MATAGFNSRIKTSTDDTTYNDIGGADSVSFSRSRAELDATDFSHTAMVKIVGIKDSSCSISGKYDAADTGQGQLETAFDDGDKIWLQFLADSTASAGSQGFKAQFVITSFEISTSSDGIVEFSAEAVLSDANGWVADNA